jgi:hypothetical protein
MSTHNGFFAVGQETFVEACALGINPACALLVMACGTGKDNVTTRWSAEAVGNHVGVRWSTAKDAISTLVSEGLIVKGGKPARPSYKLQKKGNLIWLPRTLVEGAASEAPPIAKMRQTQDPMALRLLVELYLSQNLREDGGISIKTVFTPFDRRRAGEHGPYVIWDFTKKHLTVAWTGAAKPHRREVLTEEEKQAGKNEGVDFFKRFGTLVSLGLVEWVPYLFDGPQGEPMHPLAWTGLDMEVLLCAAATEAAGRMVGESRAQSIQGIAVPVQKHIGEVAMIGVARLRYRPHTTLTAAWWAEHQNVCQGFTEQYNALAVPKVVIPQAPPSYSTGTLGAFEEFPF